MSAGAKVEGYRLRTSDDQEIGAWLVRGDRLKECVLLLHGNGESRQQMLPVMQFLADAHFTVLAISLRAMETRPAKSTTLAGARHDVIAAVTFLQRECPQQSVFIVGRSLGAAAAIFAAQELNSKVAGYFLEQPYKDLQSAVWNRLQNHLPPGLDWAAYLGLRLWSPVFLPIDPNRISPIEHIAKIPEDVPVLIVTGSSDQHARLSDVKELYGQIERHAQLIVFDGAAHEHSFGTIHNYTNRRCFASWNRRIPNRDWRREFHRRKHKTIPFRDAASIDRFNLHPVAVDGHRYSSSSPTGGFSPFSATRMLQVSVVSSKCNSTRPASR